MMEFIKITSLVISVIGIILGWVFTMLNKRIDDMKERVNNLENKVEKLRIDLENNENIIRYCYNKVRKL